METENQDQELYNMPLPDLRRLAASVMPPAGQKRSPDAQYIISVLCDKEIDQIATENRGEYFKMLDGKPNDFDEYAPY